MIRQATPDLMTAAADGGLTDKDRDDLREFEARIERGAKAWLDMGAALREIRERRLYREAHKTLEAYCFDKFRLERSMVYMLIACARRYEVARPIAEKLRMHFTAESQMRRLCVCQAVELPAVLKLAAKKTEPDENGDRFPTARILKAAVYEVRHRGAPAKAGQPSRFSIKVEDALRAMQEWNDSALLTAARGMARELTKRGLIQLFDAPTTPKAEKKKLAAPKENAQGEWANSPAAGHAAPCKD